MPKVSILIPTHNRAEVISDAVTSALNQTHEDVEVIVYDDGSNHMDGVLSKKGKDIRISPPTYQVLSKIKDKRLNYVKAKDNHGASYSRNKLMEMATGEYLMWLDSDDMCNRNRVELCLRAMDLYGPAYIRTAVTTYGSDPGNTWKLPPIVVYRGGVSFATIMFPTSNKLKFDESYKHCCEDMDWELRYAATYGRSVYIPMTLYCVGRKAQDRLTMRNKNEKYSAEYKKDTARYANVCGEVELQMKENGNTKMPLVAPWEFIEDFTKKVYLDHYGKRLAI